MNEFEGRYKDWTMDRLKKKERKFADDADYFRRLYKQYHTPENDRDLRITTDVLYAIRKEIYERTGRYGYYESLLEKDSSPTSRGWFGESKRHSEAAIKGKGGSVTPIERITGKPMQAQDRNIYTSLQVPGAEFRSDPWDTRTMYFRYGSNGQWKIYRSPLPSDLRISGNYW